MQHPFSQLHNETEFSEDSYSDEDYRTYELNYPCCKCVGREDQYNDPYSKTLEKERPINCPCCTCFGRKAEKPKVKGKFGLAYAVQTPKDNSFKPQGWQIEFQDTPSQIDRNCEKMLKWATCPPLGECNTNMEANFLWCPGEFKEVLNTNKTKKYNYEQQSIENYCLIEIPKVMHFAIEPKEATCVCQSNCAKKEKRNKPPEQQCVCATKNRTCCECRSSKNDDTYLQKQLDRFMLCRNCYNGLTKCTCQDEPSDNVCNYGQKQLKYKYYRPKNTNRESERDTLNICKHCQKSKNYYSTIEDRICPVCGKVLKKNCHIKENCTCELCDESLDYIPKRELCSKKICKQTRDCSSQIKAKDVSKSESQAKRESGPKTVENKVLPADNKIEKIPTENKVPEQQSPKIVSLR
ncbi:uncharacterized protein LOC108906150 isoform X2 [Anoplophora glabripennis]|uniref:uncharacterized protein LOC108906150 isoform X2 n=1 Tax=Anoplophora glabripennis TaxID=217634 RepID=UPI000874FEC2|nr:uncharacterized protein LOC108906150 isoform X2 [Anoplophora glabripennis]